LRDKCRRILIGVDEEKFGAVPELRPLSVKCRACGDLRDLSHAAEYRLPNLKKEPVPEVKRPDCDVTGVTAVAPWSAHAVIISDRTNGLQEIIMTAGLSTLHPLQSSARAQPMSCIGDRRPASDQSILTLNGPPSPGAAIASS
jgi:hypothetical protein